MPRSHKQRPSQLRLRTKAELIEKLAGLRQDLLKLRVLKVTSPTSPKLLGIRAARKDIARILTIMNQKARENLRKYYKDKDSLPLDLRPKKTRAIRRRLTKHQLSVKTVAQRKKDIHFPIRKYAIKA
ncbi:uncharacterized protein EI90DRAFT_2989212 [Cantharellus anzutake]|uniref:uncharacterized protein n=1 Tax=Cantharellus anzutake TaxID=1750568 RepID=UPI0019032A05|nr:uncharacterized protein EI90DRAFT_2989212 [Cantharellus anzutake]KAF8341427.1 hypothetical protein EI90DRAFT_2989212 [Cantharellus anzutake]